MNISNLRTVLLACLLALAAETRAAINDTKAVRGTLERYFILLKTGRYERVYDLLPLSAQSLTSRQEMVTGLSRLNDLLRFEKIEIGRIERKGDLAVAATAIYGTLIRPVSLDGEAISQGRITSQQYLIREQGGWKIGSINEATLRLFLKEHPTAGTLFAQQHTRFELLRSGQWVKMPGSR